ncbi:MAG: GGDEF domain-containing protein, partial [Bdellovibrionales bacterium]|nr:GGDEF domain-containing protein [Bdellovibrionales bacterium]
AVRDGLTNLFNRRYLDETLERELARAKREGYPLSLVMIDIDNFKKINDTEGHLAGDLVLQRVANVVKRCGKAGATTGRFGGEEFIVAHAGTMGSAQALAEALRRQIEREVNVTVSVGVATASQCDREVRKMVARADAALYEAKRSGKNRVCLAA